MRYIRGGGARYGVGGGMWCACVLVGIEPSYPSASLATEGRSALAPCFRGISDTIQERLSKFLFSYHITPQSSTGVYPATLLMRPHPTLRLDRLFPNISMRGEAQQGEQIQQHDTSKSL